MWHQIGKDLIAMRQQVKRNLKTTDCVEGQVSTVFDDDRNGKLL